MATRNKSLLMAYIHRKQRAEAIDALLIVFMLILTIMGVTNGYVAATATAMAAYAQYAPQLSTGLVVDQSGPFVALWLLSMVILIPIELHTRKHVKPA